MFHTCVPINAFSLRPFLTFLPFEHFNISDYLKKYIYKKPPQNFPPSPGNVSFLSLHCGFPTYISIPKAPPCTHSQITFPWGTGQARFSLRIVTGLKYNISQPVRAGKKDFFAFSELQIPFSIGKILLLLCVIHSVALYTHVHIYRYRYEPNLVYISLYISITGRLGNF